MTTNLDLCYASKHDVSGMKQLIDLTGPTLEYLAFSLELEAYSLSALLAFSTNN